MKNVSVFHYLTSSALYEARHLERYYLLDIQTYITPIHLALMYKREFLE